MFTEYATLFAFIACFFGGLVIGCQFGWLRGVLSTLLASLLVFFFLFYGVSLDTLLRSIVDRYGRDITFFFIALVHLLGLAIACLVIWILRRRRPQAQQDIESPGPSGVAVDLGPVSNVDVSFSMASTSAGYFLQSHRLEASFQQSLDASLILGELPADLPRDKKKD